MMARQPKSFWVPAICDCLLRCGNGRKQKASILRLMPRSVERYATEASDEEWLTMMGQVGREVDPGLACLKRAFERAVCV